jgi:hypothetical protein
MQLGFKVGLRVDALPDCVDARVPQVLGDEFGVIGPILQDQDA